MIIASFMRVVYPLKYPIECIAQLFRKIVLAVRMLFILECQMS